LTWISFSLALRLVRKRSKKQEYKKKSAKTPGKEFLSFSVLARGIFFRLHPISENNWKVSSGRGVGRLLGIEVGNGT
jgi:hypothetical protein